MSSVNYKSNECVPRFRSAIARSGVGGWGPVLLADPRHHFRVRLRSIFHSARHLLRHRMRTISTTKYKNQSIKTINITNDITTKKNGMAWHSIPKICEPMKLARLPLDGVDGRSQWDREELCRQCESLSIKVTARVLILKWDWITIIKKCLIWAPSNVIGMTFDYSDGPSWLCEEDAGNHSTMHL